MSKTASMHDSRVAGASANQFFATGSASLCKASDWIKRKNILYADCLANCTIHTSILPIFCGEESCTDSPEEPFVGAAHFAHSNYVAHLTGSNALTGSTNSQSMAT
jgi:hypothetical protein